MSYRILHSADIHLDRPFATMGCYGDLARQRRQSLRDALTRMGEQANKYNCSAITIGGDLFEHEHSDIDTRRFLEQTFARWDPIRVFLAPGNHDPLIPDSLYFKASWTSNVHLFTEKQLTPVVLEDGLNLWGLAHHEQAWQGDPLDCPPPPTSADINIALFHGAETYSLPHKKSIHGPFAANDIKKRGFVAALCGHYHRQRLDSKTGLLYPGSPEPLAMDETGRRGPVIVTIENTGEIEFYALASNSWYIHPLISNITECDSSQDITHRACRECFAAISGFEPEKTIVSLSLEGNLKSDISLDIPALEKAVKDHTHCAAVRAVDRTTLDFDLKLILGEQTARGNFARLMENTINEKCTDKSNDVDDDEIAILNNALQYGLRALSGVPLGNP